MQGLKAPHKPLLLLAVMNLMERGIIDSNRFTLTNELNREFERLWDILVDDRTGHSVVTVCEGLDLSVSRVYPFKCNISNPFYFMQYEPFYSLEKSERWRKRSSYGAKALREDFLYAELDSDFYEALTNEATRETLRNTLLNMI